jgi:hypothetical protein
MALVGDMIFRVRSKIPDLPPVVPIVPSVSFSIVTPASSTLTSGTYFAVLTQLNSWGETLQSEESSFTVGVGQAISAQSVPIPGAVAIRVYLSLVGGAAGSECQFVQSSGITYPFTQLIISSNPASSGIPPIRSTAYMMDSDGFQFGASTVYDWMNEGLNKISRVVGGLLDYCGVPTQVGQPLYVMPGEWVEITDVWYGGYWVKGGKRGDFFRKNTVNASILDAVAVSVFTNQQVIEVSYQPDRASGVTATTANMAATDTSAQISNIGVFLLPFGFAQIGSEIVAYSSLTGTTIGGLIRGLGGSAPQAWPSGTTVTELSLFWCGKRLLSSDSYSPGQAMSPLAVPEGWESILPLYMLAQAKKAELDMKTASDLEKQCYEEATRWMLGNKGVVSQVQVGGFSLARPWTFSNTIAGGLIVP